MENPENDVRDCALVFEGGGYRASYTAGIARVLLEQGIDFGYVCGISAGASHTVDYVSRDLWRTRVAFLGRDGARSCAERASSTPTTSTRARCAMASCPSTGMPS